MDENIRLKQEIERNKHVEVTEPAHCSHFTECSVKEPVVSSSNGDIMLWNMLERNRYLENKIGKLKGQYEKQAKTLSSIRTSEKWRNRNQCNPQGNSCYEDKYLQLLRIRSPFYWCLTIILYYQIHILRIFVKYSRFWRRYDRLEWHDFFGLIIQHLKTV